MQKSVAPGSDPGGSARAVAPADRTRPRRPIRRRRGYTEIPRHRRPHGGPTASRLAAIEKMTYVAEIASVVYQSQTDQGTHKKNFEIFAAEEFIAANTQHIQNPVDPR